MSNKAIAYRKQNVVGRRGVLTPLQHLKIAVWGYIPNGHDQLCPDKPGNPLTPMYIFKCEYCGWLNRGYRQTHAQYLRCTCGGILPVLDLKTRIREIGEYALIRGRFWLRSLRARRHR